MKREKISRVIYLKKIAVTVGDGTIKLSQIVLMKGE